MVEHADAVAEHYRGDAHQDLVQGAGFEALSGDVGAEDVDVLVARGHLRLRESGPTMHGAVGVAIPVRRADETAAVLKISFPHPGNIAEPKALAT